MGTYEYTMDVEKSDLVGRRFIAIFCTYILIAATIIWSANVSAADEPEIKPFGEEEWKKLKEVLGDAEKLEKNFKIKVDGKGNVVFVDGDLKDKQTTLDDLVKNIPGVKDGLLTVKTTNTNTPREMVIPLKDLPSDVQGIEVKGGNVVYTQKAGDGTATVTIDADGAYLKKGSDGKTVVEGYKTHDGKEKKIVISGLGKGGDVRIKMHYPDIVASNGQTPKKVSQIFYKGKGTVVSVDGLDLEAISGQEGSFMMLDEGKGAVVGKTTIRDTNKKVNIAVDDFNVYYGGKGGEGKDLYFEGETLKGDVTKISGLNLSNEGDKEVKTEIKAKNGGEDGKEGTYSVAIGKKGSEKVGIKVEDGKILATKEGVQGTTTTSDNGDRPTLPEGGSVSGQGSGGSGNNISNNGSGTPPVTPPGGPGGGPGGGGEGGGGLGSWLKWALIIGAGILALMLLLGKKKDKGGEENSGGVDDGGEKYMGKDNTTNVFGNVTDGRDGNKTTHYNPSEPLNQDRFCECNASGCFNCPGDNCFACSSNSTAPVVQSVNSSSTTTNSSTQNTSNSN